MNPRLSLLTAACALALAACGGGADRADPGAAAPTPAPADTAPNGTTTPAPAPETDAAPPETGKPAAVVANCSTQVEGNDALQFNVGSITVPSSCAEFTITLRHTGQMPVAAMGHNVVITRAADRQAVAAAGQSAGVDGGFLPAGDPRVLAHTDLIGGGGTTSVTFPVSAIQGDGPYEFFCSFPGHWAVMRGTILVD
jgi:azurin